MRDEVSSNVGTAVLFENDRVRRFGSSPENRPTSTITPMTTFARNA